MAYKKKEVSGDIRKRIVMMAKDGYTQRKISEILNVPKSTVGYIVKKHNDTGLISNKPGRGRKSLITSRMKSLIVRKVKQNRRQSAQSLVEEISESYGIKVSDQTVRNTIHQAGLHGRVARKKPHLSIKNIRKRLQFAKEYHSKPKDYWNQVIFSDESKFNISGSDGRVIVWRGTHEEYSSGCIRQTVKHGGGGVMVWGCMAASGVGRLVFIDDILTAAKYLVILQENLNASALELGLKRSWIFQQDNDPKHTAKIVKAYLDKKYKNRVLPWPAQSPDLNPIEHLWDELGRRLRKHKITNKADLKEKILDEWSKIPPEVTKKLVDSMTRRLAMVVKQKGRQTKY
jgi:transposase